MKNNLLAIISLAFLGLASCKKDATDSARSNNAELLVECTTNGKEWKLYKNDSFNVDGISGNKAPSIIVTKNGRNLSFSIHKWDNTDTAVITATVYVNDGLTMLGNYEFDFANDPMNQHYIRYIKLDRSAGPPADMTNSVGYFKITGHSPGSKTISGEFGATVTNRNFRGQTSTVTIQSGKFTNITYQE